MVTDVTEEPKKLERKPNIYEGLALSDSDSGSESDSGNESDIESGSESDDESVSSKSKKTGINTFANPKD